jgi:hypothetical protein
VYEVVIPQNGIRDWTGNGTPQEFRSRFTTRGSTPIHPRLGQRNGMKPAGRVQPDGRRMRVVLGKGTGVTASIVVPEN